ncbi:MAG: hypothetical protein KA264_02185 [Crocinitomicaceae bacterium]|jgi:hypothetical protein|nr:hypothetical protein [Crocinitomicaceae bacterium]
MKKKGATILLTIGIVSLITVAILIKLHAIPLKNIVPLIGVSISALILGLSLSLCKNIPGTISATSYVFALSGTSILLLNSIGGLTNFVTLWSYAIGASIISLLIGLFNYLKSQGFKYATFIFTGLILPLGIILKIEAGIFYGMGFLILGLVSVISLMGSLNIRA